MSNPFLSIDQQIVGDIYTSTETLYNLITLCDDFGSRFGGTTGERLAAEYIQRKMTVYGLVNVHQEPIEYLGWTRGEARLEVLHPINRTIPCISLPQSPPSKLEGEIIDMGEGAPDDFDSRASQIKGKIVMASSEINPKNTKRWVHRSEKFGRSVLAGATAFIFANHYPAYGPATGGVGFQGEAALIPGISVSKEDGAYLQRLAKRDGPLKIRLVTSDTLAPMTSWNLVGDLLGDQFPQEIVMLGSHYDGHDISQGANDPASGVVSVLEAARVLRKYAAPLPRTLRFVCWGIEEIGLLGSRAYVKEHEDELKDIRFYLNMDAAGGVNPKDIMLHEWPELQETFDRYQDEMALDFAVGQSFHTASDHFPFLLAGVTTGGIESVRKSRTGRGYGHTYFDTVDKVSLLSLRDAASLAARLAYRIVVEKDWPASPRDDAAVAALLEQPDQKEVQAWRDRLATRYQKP